MTLYKALVWPFLEYGYVALSPINGYNVPDCILEFCFYLPLLHLRHYRNGLMLLFKLVNGFLDCPDMLGGIELAIPKETRSMTIPYMSTINLLLCHSGLLAPYTWWLHARSFRIAQGYSMGNFSEITNP